MGSPEPQQREAAAAEGAAIVYVNGKRHVLPQGAGHVSLLSYLRGGSSRRRRRRRRRRQLAWRLLPCRGVVPSRTRPVCQNRGRPAQSESTLGFEADLLEHSSTPAADLGLTGAKLGCGEGGCGACTVLVSSADPATGALHHRSINACLCPLYAVRALGPVSTLRQCACCWGQAAACMHEGGKAAAARLGAIAAAGDPAALCCLQSRSFA